jgi:hypothetical protein
MGFASLIATGSQALELEYTFESNRIEGNTMTLRETDLVINEGLTISGKVCGNILKSLIIKTIAYIKDLMQRNSSINEREYCLYTILF